MTTTEASDFADILGQGETPLYVARWSKMPLVGWNLLSVPLYMLGVPLFLDGLRGMGFTFLAIAVLISASAYASWIGRKAIVTNRRVIYYAALSKAVSAIPLDKIEQIKQVTGQVRVLAGNASNTLTLWVPDAEALASTIESARTNALAAPQIATYPPGITAEKKKKEASKAELLLGKVTLGIIALGILVYNLPDQEKSRSVLDGEQKLDAGLSETKSTPSTRAAPPVLLADPASPPSDMPSLDVTKSAAVEELCVKLQLTAEELADARNKGVPEDIALREMIGNSQDAVAVAMLTSVVELVYANSDTSPALLGSLTYLTCLKTWGNQN